jgi:hypothetical protein
MQVSLLAEKEQSQQPKVPTNLFRSGIRQITAGPQTVLDQTMALMTQMHCQGLHSTSFDDGRLVA